MTPDQRLLVIGLYINSALYLTGTFVAGIVTQHPWAWRASLASAGVSYIAYALQLPSPGKPETPGLNLLAVLLSVALGLAAGLILLFG